MYIEYKEQKYGLCFENDYLDILCFELGYEFSEADLKIRFETVFNEETKQDEIRKDEKGNFTPILDNAFFKKFRDILYSLLKASFCQKVENKYIDFPLTHANVTAIMMQIIADGRLEEFLNNMNDANKAFLPQTKKVAVVSKKKLVGTK